MKAQKRITGCPHRWTSLNATMTIDEQLAFTSEHSKYAEAIKLLNADKITWDELTEVIESITNKSVRNFISIKSF